MKTSHLKYFLAIADNGSFSSAAKEIYVSQPVLTKSIATLEKELGFRLFNRSTKRALSLTDEGKQFLPTAREAVDLLDCSILRIQEFSKGDAGNLKVSHFSISRDPQFVEMISAFQQQRGGAVDICETGPYHAVKMLMEGSLDAALLITSDYALVPSALERFFVARAKEAIVVSEDHPFAGREFVLTEEIDCAQVVFPHQMNPWVSLVTNLLFKDAEREDIMFLSSAESALALVASQEKCLVMLECYRPPEGFVSIPIKTDESLDVLMAWHPDNRSQVLCDFISFAKTRVKRQDYQFGMPAKIDRISRDQKQKSPTNQPEQIEG